jgi:hypothetical protein
MLLYLAFFFFLYAFALALPGLVEAASQLPASGEPLTPEELERAERVSQAALRGKLHWVFIASVLTVSVGAWYGKLPGIRA